MASLIYSHIYLYRAALNVLYGGKYRLRFSNIVEMMGRDVRSVCDLCFGDTIVAEWCRSRGIHWTGVDLNAHFCARARRLGFEVIEGDLLTVDLPSADVFIMAGSLYHFHGELSRLFDRVLYRAPRFILSEPVRNLSSQRGLLGSLARLSGDPGNGEAAFRYDEDTLLDALREQRARLGITFQAVSKGRDMLVDIARNDLRVTNTPVLP